MTAGIRRLLVYTCALCGRTAEVDVEQNEPGATSIPTGWTVGDRVICDQHPVVGPPPTTLVVSRVAIRATAPGWIPLRSASFDGDEWRLVVADEFIERDR